MADIQTQQLGGLQQQITELSKKIAAHKHTRSDLTAGLDNTIPTQLIDAATIVCDASRSDYFFMTLGGNRTLANPTGAFDGEKIVFEIIQDGTGSRTLTLGSKFTFGTSLASITLSTSANKRDFLGVIYRSATDLYYVVAFMPGY